MTAPVEAIVLGVDPGLGRSLGLARVELTRSGSRAQALDRPQPRKGLSASDKVEEALRILWGLELEGYDAIAVEDQAGVEVGAQRAAQERAAAKGAEAGAWGSNASSRRVHEVFGGVRLLAIAWELPLVVIAPSTAKVAITGNGRATKEQVRSHVQLLFGARLREHDADAVAVGVAGGRRWLRESRIDDAVQRQMFGEEKKTP